MAVPRLTTKAQLRRFAEYRGFDNTQKDFLVNAIGQDIEASSANQALLTTAGAGALGTGGFYNSGVTKDGSIFTTRILIDLTGLASSTTDLDIIGVSTTPAYIGRITTAQNGLIQAGRVTCLEAPAGGVADIDVYGAVEATGVFDSPVGDLTETILLTNGASWTLGMTKGLVTVPAADAYIYLTGGAAGTAATYTAGKFMLEFFGVAA
jgi:hypothetical protein